MPCKDPEKRAAWSRAYYRNTGIIRAKSPAGKAAQLAYNRKYHQTHPEANWRGHTIRRARKQGNGVFLVLEKDLRRLLDRYRHACAYCGAKGKLSWDHVIPIARGGRHSIGNLLPACRSCNSSKNSKFIVEWRQASC